MTEKILTTVVSVTCRRISTLRHSTNISAWRKHLLYVTPFTVVTGFHGYLSDITCHVNPLNAELNSICHLLALLGDHHILHFSRIRVKA